MKKNTKIIIVMVILLLIIAVAFIYLYESPPKYDKQQGYDKKLELAIAEHDKKLESEKKKNDFFSVPKEMEEDPKYKMEDGTIDVEAIARDMGIDVTYSGSSALGEINLSAKENIVEPHVLGHAQVAIYSNSNKAWPLEKGDRVIFRTYVDTAYYGVVGRIDFGVLQDGEKFSLKNVEKGTAVDEEASFEYVVPEAGEYRFFIFRGSTEPIIIKGIEVSIK